jgi:hypothetical protein
MEVRVGRSVVLAGMVAVLLLAAACGGEDAKRGSTSKSTVAGDVPNQPAATVGSSQEMAAQAQAPKSSNAGTGAAQAAAPAPNGQPQASGGQLPGTDRKIIYNVFLDLTVKDVQTSFERIGRIAQDSGGLIAESNIRQEGKERRATITIRVPSGRYQDVMGLIRGLGTAESERSNANDVTEEFADLRSRQRNLEATESQLLVFLGQAKNIQEVLQVQDRLNTVRAEIERIKGRMNLLDRLSDLATIQVQLRPESAVTKPAPATTGAVAALRRGWDASTELLGGLGIAALTVAGFSWWLLPVLALALWLVRRETRRRGAAYVPATAPPASGEAT